MVLRVHPSAVTNKESLGPFRTYLLTRGLALNFNSEGGVVNGGSRTCLPFTSAIESDENGLFPAQVYSTLLDRIEEDIGVNLVGSVADSSNDVMFRVDEYVISTPWLAEGLLLRLKALENLLQRRVLDSTGIDVAQLNTAKELCANWEKDIWDGQVGPDDLQQRIDRHAAARWPVKQAFFISNAIGISEDIRNAILAACHHFGTLNSGMVRINESKQLEWSLPTSFVELSPDVQPWEIRHFSEEVDPLSFAYTSSVIACYTALDLLYEFFVYLTREPFLNPDFPKGLHFPDAPGRATFRDGGASLTSDPPSTDFPFSIANLSPGQFASLRNSRNALVHNMAPDSLRPRVYVGWRLPPVNNQALRYVQYLSRDIDTNGDPVVHAWVRRFYENDTDAQHSLFGWLESAWQCIFDTTEWLIKRWSTHVT